MKIYVSVVSHNHGKLIKNLDVLSKLNNDNIIIIIKNNINDPALVTYCLEKKIILIDENYFKGFGENNNLVFQYIVDNFEITRDDYFLVLNPDVIIDKETLINYVSTCSKERIKLSTLNLYIDRENNIYDNNIRKFPNIITFFNSFLFKKNNSLINKVNIKHPQEMDWAAGSFLLFNIYHYKKINGFNQRYFMYCEDIDICYRSARAGQRLTYLPQFSAIHLAKHENRNIFSKHFFWHLKSVFIFLLTKNFKLKILSKIK
ncbi:glycosyltransferase family 2 protein [Providencia rettgeri]|nr:glycosyltransferase family 2 protein [Providencia rettgeri]